MSKFAIKEVLPGKLNAMVKNIMAQTGITDPNEAVRSFNSGEWTLNRTTQPCIDCDVDLFCPDNWTVEEHIKGGQVDLSKIELYLCEEQKRYSIEGNELRKKLANQPVLNACVLDYLLANPNLIPEEWKGKAVFFWGTIYRDSDCNLCVRFMNWDGSQWVWVYYCLCYHWDDNYPAAVSSAS